LASSGWQQADLETLLRDAVTAVVPATEQRIQFVGPNVQVQSHAAQALALLVHELATNALRHGALSVPTGIVRVGWKLENDEFYLNWTELGGPEYEPEKTSHGFGHTILFELTPNALNGTVGSRTKPTASFVYTLSSPQSNIRVSSVPVSGN